jgi:UPF0716 protein FxsA
MMPSLRFIVMLVFLGFPLLEIAVLIQVGQMIGFWPTLGLLILSATLGMIVIRQQGLSMVGRMFEAVSQGRFAVASMLDSYATIAAGCQLIVPGFISDLLGLALLVPPLRRLVLGAMLPGIAGPRRSSDAPSASAQRPSDAARPIVIEGTYERLDDDSDTKR